MPFCSALYNHVAVNLPQQSWKPCCRFEDKAIYSISTTSIGQYKDSNYFNIIKKSMEDGWHSGCLKCKQEEDLGVDSYRIKLNRNSEQTELLEHIEISLSNECNLTCRMCDPTYSTKWNNLVKTNPTLNQYRRQNNPIAFNLKDIFRDVDLSKLNRIKYLGGEPFITKEIEQLFKFLDRNNIIHNITFIVVTNGTLFPEKYLNYIKKFKRIMLTVSIDGVGSLNDYIREGKNWSAITKNINKWVEYRNTFGNIEICFSTTLQAYNIHDLSNLKAFADQYSAAFHVHKLSYPNELSIDCLPQSYLNNVKDQFNYPWISTINNNNMFEQFKQYTLTMDSITGKSIQQYIPGLYQYF